MEAAGYKGVLEFHLDLQKMLNETRVRGPVKKHRCRISALRTTYEKAVKQVYPWFDVKTPWAHFEEEPDSVTCVDLPCEDHNYTDLLQKKRRRRMLAASGGIASGYARSRKNKAMAREGKLLSTYLVLFSCRCY